mmetsp:Transcript_24413/g.52636  ORF Transcript_24413/g.52636 Transcript_24413/m.52636 type:complete len:97 (-) Transcript_24413:117-407(-)
MFCKMDVKYQSEGVRRKKSGTQSCFETGSPIGKRSTYHVTQMPAVLDCQSKVGQRYKLLRAQHLGDRVGLDCLINASQMVRSCEIQLQLPLARTSS